MVTMAHSEKSVLYQNELKEATHALSRLKVRHKKMER